MKLKIIRKKDGTFNGDEGQKIAYYWYKALDVATGVTIEFGSKVKDHPVGKEVELDIEKSERAGGKFGYKEISE